MVATPEARTGMPDVHPGAARLADGTRLEDLIDEGTRTVSARIHADPEIFQLELERIFARAWIPVAHVSELNEPGDFVTRYVGRDRVIVTRDFEGELRVLLNICTHRGMQLCRAEVGNARLHTCPFHGWAFTPDGKLKGVPFERKIYGERLEKADLGLRQARVGVFAGLVFATFDPEAPALEEFIGDFGWYLEAMLDRTDAGLEVVGPPQRFVVEANWKVVLDGFFGDAYHVITVHNRSFSDVGLGEAGDDTALYQFKASALGHSALCFDLGHFGLPSEPTELFATIPPTGVTPELLGQLEGHLEPEQIAMLASTPPAITALFPSTALLMILGGPTGQTCSLRFFVPVSATRTEILSFYLVERDADPESRRQLHVSSIRSFGVGGMFESDDVEVWAGVQRGFEGVVGRRMIANYQSVGEPLASDPTRPGVTYRGVSTDDNQWFFYERWLDFLVGRA